MSSSLPSGSSHASQPTDSSTLAHPPGRRLRRAALGSFGIALATALWAFVIEPRRLVVREQELALERWPAATPPLRLALLSDLHVGSPHWGLDRLPRVVEATNAATPDVVVFAGDFMNDLGTRVPPEPIAEILGGLRPRLGTVAVLGNHDWWHDGDRITRVLTEHGIAVLENETRTFTRAGAAIVIAGLADVLERTPRPAETFATAPPDAALIAVVHEPDIFPRLGPRPAITLAGHTHGGQVALPLLGRPVVPSAYGQRYAYGHVVENGNHLYVTGGVGMSVFPVRFGVPPEIVILTLHAR